MKLNKSIINNKKAYDSRLEIATINVPLNHIKEVYDLPEGESHPDGKVLDLDPFYQRGLVWTLDQKRDYIIALFNGRATIEPTIAEYYQDNYKYHIMEVIDGKQRLTTVFDFINNKFSIIVDETEVYFRNLIEKDQRFLIKHDVKETRIMSRDISKEIPISDILDIFIEINEKGTKMSDNHLKKIKKTLELYNIIYK